LPLGFLSVFVALLGVVGAAGVVEVGKLVALHCYLIRTGLTTFEYLKGHKPSPPGGHSLTSEEKVFFGIAVETHSDAQCVHAAASPRASVDSLTAIKDQLAKKVPHSMPLQLVPKKRLWPDHSSFAGVQMAMPDYFALDASFPIFAKRTRIS